MSWRERRAALKGADLSALKLALYDSNRFVRSEAVRLLAAHPERDGASAELVACLHDRSVRVRRAILTLLPTFGPEALPVLEQLVQKESWGMILAAAPELAALAETKPHPGQRGLAALLRRRAAVWWSPLRPGDRKALHSAAERIEAATDHLKDLPLSATPPAAPEDLPRPADLPVAEARELPIPWWRRLF
jgi:hypothetical protein